MRPCVSISWGGAIQFLNSPMGPRVVSQDLTNAPLGSNDVSNEYASTLTAGVSSDYWVSNWGGTLSMLPANTPHKPGSFYYGDFYYYRHSVKHIGGHFLLKFDGSGIAVNEGGTGFGNKSLSGRGTRFISPSGNPDIAGGPMCVLPHNGSLFFIGSTFNRNWNTTTSNYITKLGWDTGPNNSFSSTGNDTGTATPRRRAYCSYFITKKDKNSPEHKGFGKLSILYNRTLPSGLTTSYEDLNACDAISWGDDIFYANNVDIVQFPGGSGSPRLVELTNQPSSKCFGIYPTSGFVNGSPLGDPRLLVLTGSGVLKRINFPGDTNYNTNGRPFGSNLFQNVQQPASGKPYGTTALVNLGSLVSDFLGPKVRTRGPRGRIGSTTAQPDRNCLLKVHDNKLHAFFISAASGYYHFTCDGDPSVLDNWTDRTASVPTNLKIRDGNIYGFVDENFGTLNILHVAYSNVGVFGTNGANTGAGGWTLYSLNHDLVWRSLYSGASNGPPCGLIPYNPEGVYVQIPSGIYEGPAPGNPIAIASTDYVEIQYKLFCARKPNRIADVSVQYTTDDGVSWHNAKRFKDYVTGELAGSGISNLEATPEGKTYTFTWAHVSDVGMNSNKNIRLRILPRFVR